MAFPLFSSFPVKVGLAEKRTMIHDERNVTFCYQSFTNPLWGKGAFIRPRFVMSEKMAGAGGGLKASKLLIRP